MKTLSELLNNVNWNIGFVEGLTPDKLLQERKMPIIKWLKHNYRDRAFADPFILDSSEQFITILCEEIIFGKKGKISKLKVERASCKLADKKVLLELPTHLSYPAIIEADGDIYVYPENGEAGGIKKYRYNPETESLEECGILADGALIDFTVCHRKIGDKWIALCTKLHPDAQVNAWLYQAGNKLGPYTPASDSPVVKSRACSRQGGNFFSVGTEFYRPAQDCIRRYGCALRIMHVRSFVPYDEEEVMVIKPRSFRYNLGIHTLNFGDGFAVTDGYGYLYLPVGIVAKILSPLNQWRLKMR